MTLWTRKKPNVGTAVYQGKDLPHPVHIAARKDFHNNCQFNP